jgi:riboflavin-specific deaminase-like protein
VTSLEALLQRYQMPRAARDDRPWVLLNLVLSADGHASLDGRVTQLTSATDQALFQHLRAQSDAILVGAATVRAEKYGPVRVSEAAAAQRLVDRRAERPTLVIVSRSLDIEIDRVAVDGQPVVVLTCATSNATRRAHIAQFAEVIVVGDDSVDLERALVVLHRRGIGVVLCEGGAVLNGELAQAGLVDEVCVTVAPVLGGDPSTQSGAPLHGSFRMELQHAHALDGNVFMRWLVS